VSFRVRFVESRESGVEIWFSKMGGGMRLPKVTSRVSEEVLGGEEGEKGCSAYVTIACRKQLSHENQLPTGKMCSVETE
jgi:hypothetical protein